MKNKYNCEWLSMNSKKDMGKVKMSLMDNVDWEYDRVGIGMNKEKVFIVDLDDCNESWREVEYCDNVKSIEELLKIGVECKVFEKIEANARVNSFVILFPKVFWRNLSQRLFKGWLVNTASPDYHKP